MTRPVVALTGATGFIGRRLVTALTEAGCHVRALARRVPAPKPGDDEHLSWVSGSLENTASLNALVQNAIAVIHVAGAIKALSRDDFFKTNARGTEALAAAAATQIKPPRFIFLSSLAAREPRLSPYAASKRAGEQALKRFRSAMPVAVVRPPAVYGPGDAETARIFQMAARGFFLAPQIERARLSLVHVDDVAGAVMAVLQSETLPDKPVEFDDGTLGGYGWDEIAAATGDALQKELRVIRVPVPFLYLAGAAGTAAGLLTSRPNVLSWAKVPELLHPDWVASGENVPEAYKPLWNIEKGFKNAASWYASQGLLIK